MCMRYVRAYEEQGKGWLMAVAVGNLMHGNSAPGRSACSETEHHPTLPCMYRYLSTAHTRKDCRPDTPFRNLDHQFISKPQTILRESTSWLHLHVLVHR